MTYFKVFEGRALILSAVKAYLFKMYVWRQVVCVQKLFVFEGVCIRRMHRAYASGRMHRGVCIGACAPWA
jgi:hypothetical protein